MATRAVDTPEETLAERLAATAAQAIQNYETAGKALVAASEALQLVERERAHEKMAAIARICEQDHPATVGKRFSISQAEDFAQLDPAYQIFKQRCADLALAKQEAELEVSTARLLAELAIASFRAEAGLQ